MTPVSALEISTHDIAPEAVHRWRALVERRARRAAGRCNCGCQCSATPSARWSIRAPAGRELSLTQIPAKA